MENECEALPGVAYPGVRDNRSTINTQTGYDDYDVPIPHLDATCIPVSRSNGQRSGSPDPLLLTHIMHHIFRTARPTNFKLGVQMEDDGPYQPQAP